MSITKRKSNSISFLKTNLYQPLVKSLYNLTQLDLPYICNIFNEYFNTIIPYYPIGMGKRSGTLFIKKNWLYYTFSSISKTVYITLCMLPMSYLIRMSYVYMILLNSIIIVVSLMSILMDCVLHHCCYDLVSVRNWLNLHEKTWFNACRPRKKRNTHTYYFQNVEI